MFIRNTICTWQVLYCPVHTACRSIWFATVAGYLFWYAYMKATINTGIAALIGKNIKFKTTEKSTLAKGVSDQANKAKKKLQASPLGKFWASVQVHLAASRTATPAVHLDSCGKCGRLSAPAGCSAAHRNVGAACMQRSAVQVTAARQGRRRVDQAWQHAAGLLHIEHAPYHILWGSTSAQATSRVTAPQMKRRRQLTA